MSTPLFFSPPSYVARLPLGGERFTLRELCRRAKVVCRASGGWTERPVTLQSSAHFAIIAEASPRHGVLIQTPLTVDQTETARLALAVLAYALMDQVARESIRGQPWARLAATPGRPRSGRARNNRERQRKYRRSE